MRSSRAAGSLSSALQCRDAFLLTLEEALKLSGQRCLVSAGAWELLGHRELMQTQAGKLLYCYGADASNMETSLAMIKVALARLRSRSVGLSVCDATSSWVCTCGISV